MPLSICYQRRDRGPETPWKCGVFGALCIIPTRRAVCLAMRYSLVSPSPQCPPLSARGVFSPCLYCAFTPIAAHGKDPCYKVATCQALHLTRCRRPALPPRLTTWAGVTSAVTACFYPFFRGPHKTVTACLNLLSRQSLFGRPSLFASFCRRFASLPAGPSLCRSAKQA